MNCCYCHGDCEQDGVWRVGDSIYCLSCFQGLCDDAWWQIVTTEGQD